MYEKFGFKSLERLVGLDVPEICFARDHIQILFDDVVLTCYTLPEVHVAGERVALQDERYRDLLCSFIGEVVQSVAEVPQSELRITFGNQNYITISLRREDARGPEAAMLVEKRREIFDVWRYE